MFYIVESYRIKRNRKITYFRCPCFEGLAIYSNICTHIESKMFWICVFIFCVLLMSYYIVENFTSKAWSYIELLKILDFSIKKDHIINIFLTSGILLRYVQKYSEIFIYTWMKINSYNTSYRIPKYFNKFFGTIWFKKHSCAKNYKMQDEFVVESFSKHFVHII